MSRNRLVQLLSHLLRTMPMVLGCVFIYGCTGNTQDLQQLSGAGGDGKLATNEVWMGEAAGAIPAAPASKTATPTPEKPDNAGKSLAAPAGSPAGNDSPQELNAVLAELNKGEDPAYRIQRGDVIDISIPTEPDSLRTVTVRPDGHLSYLYDIDLRVAGLTYPELVVAMKEKLAAYYIRPAISVNSRSFAGSQMYVMGPIDKPGPVTVQNNTRLLDVMAMAGVLKMLPQNQLTATSNAEVTNDVVDLKNAYMMRNGNILPIDFQRLLRGRDMRYNIFVKAGDFVFFPSSYLSDVTKRVYVCGAVEAPRVYTFTTYGTFMSAIANSGGIQKYRADGNRCLIIRKSQKKIMSVSYNNLSVGKTDDIELQDSDIVFVPERGLYENSRWSTTVISELIAPLHSLIQGDSAAKTVNMQNWSPQSEYGLTDYFVK